MRADTIGSGSPKRGGFRPRASHYLLAAEALDEILAAQRPADAIVAGLLRRRRAGARDRKVVTQLVYGVLRNFFRLRERLGGSPAMLELCAAATLDSDGTVPPLRELDASQLAQQLSQTRACSVAASHNLPGWMWEALAGQFPADEAAALALALNGEASVDLRANLLRGSRDEALHRLRADQVQGETVEGIDTAIRLTRRVPLQGLPCFREGWVEPQDAGSQKLVIALAPAPGERIADFCAGAGGKTLAIGALMRNEGTLVAMDTSASRLSRLGPRAQRAGLTIVEAIPLPASGAAPAGLHESFDAVLVDAPCSGTGTLRRHPELRLQPDRRSEFQSLQGGILDSAARLLRPGGRLMYATCSLFREENEDVLEGFLGRNPAFRLAQTLRLLPHRDGTDGYYAATLRRDR